MKLQPASLATDDSVFHVAEQIKRIAKVKAGDTFCSPLIPRSRHLTTKGNQVSQAPFPLGKSTLTIPKHLLHVPRNSFQEGWLHDFPEDWTETDWLHSLDCPPHPCSRWCSVFPLPITGAPHDLPKMIASLQWHQPTHSKASDTSRWVWWTSTGCAALGLR